MKRGEKPPARESMLLTWSRNKKKNEKLCHCVIDGKTQKKNFSFMEPLNLPSPIAAQQSTVTIDKVTLRLVMECAGRGLRSQHLDIR